MDAPNSVLMAVLWAIGSLGIFLYGIEMMGKALRRAAGLAFRRCLGKLTQTRFHGLATGAVFTGIVQSSSATTVMVVGFISAGLLSFENSIGLILGANIGTTITPQIMALDLDQLAVPFIGIGFLINFFSKRKYLRELGTALMGFGLLFFGLILMKFAVSGYSETIHGWLTTYASGGIQGWIVAFAISMAVTAIIQSSAATVVMIQALAFQGAITDINLAIPMILGAHVGTCITALLASIKVNLSARRAAIAHLVFNMMATLLTIIALKFYLWLIPQTADTLPHQIANGHLVIKLINVLIFLPFTTLLARLVIRIVPGEDKMSATPEFLAAKDLNDPAKVLKNSYKEIRRMCQMCGEIIQDAVEALLRRDEVLQEEVIKKEDLVDDLYYTIADYAFHAAKKDLPAELSDYPAYLFHMMNEVERIGDHAENIVEMSQAYATDDVILSRGAIRDVKEIMGVISKMSKLVVSIMEKKNEEKIEEILNLNHDFKNKKREMLAAHENRITTGDCMPFAGIFYIDLIDNLSSVATHLRHIARSIQRRKEIS